MNIAVEVRAGDMKIGQMEKITECVVVFVAVEPDGKTIPVEAWQPETPSDIALAQYVKTHLDLARASLSAA
jgi:acyl-CoA hydrolase